MIDHIELIDLRKDHQKSDIDLILERLNEEYELQESKMKREGLKLAMKIMHSFEREVN